MGQYFTFNLLKSLGGSATRREIGDRAREATQGASLSSRVGEDLRHLRSWGYISYDAKSDSYRIVQEFPEPNVV